MSCSSNKNYGKETSYRQPVFCGGGRGGGLMFVDQNNHKMCINLNQFQIRLSNYSKYLPGYNTFKKMWFVQVKWCIVILWLSKTWFHGKVFKLLGLQLMIVLWQQVYKVKFLIYPKGQQRGDNNCHLEKFKACKMWLQHLE